MKHLWLAGCLKCDSYKRNVWLCDFHKDTLIAPKMYSGRLGVPSMLQQVFLNLQINVLNLLILRPACMRSRRLRKMFYM